MNNESPKIIGIAGGSGSGKSTLATSLVRKYPDKVALVHLDDYFKRSFEAPKMGDFINWDHPDALRFNDLISDLEKLKDGKSITVMTKSKLYNPTYDNTRETLIEYVIEPKPVVLFEGYLAFHNPQVRDLLDTLVFLDIPVVESVARRAKDKFTPDERYFSEVLLPMHQQFVEPTKEYADLVIDVAKKDQNETLVEVEEILKRL